MKKILVLLSCILIPTIVSAQEEKVQALIVQLRTGNEHAYVLSEKPTVTLPNDSMLIHGNSFETKYSRLEVSKFYFEKISKNDPRNYPVGIKGIGKENLAFYYFDGKNVRISGLKNGTIVSVYTLDGKCISTQKSIGNGAVTVSLGNLPKGVYVISYGNRSVKINR